MHTAQDNLDLDLFCRLIIHEDIDYLQHLPCFNSYRENTRGIVRVVAEEERAGQMQDDVSVLQGLPRD
jgi:hypothetical protein